MDKAYDHKKFEEDIYKRWENSGSFSPQPFGHPSTGRSAMSALSNGSERRMPPFTIIMPPPNANDPLHIGHAREVATQDILIRYHRMKSDPTLWLPGADHAGIETQYVFEKKLKDKGKSRFDFDRDTLYKMIWDYVQENKSTMERQLRQLGASCDWTRFKFTLDPEIIKIVYETFKKLYSDGLVYRGERIVNYCPRCGTNYSELEVDHIEKVDPIYYIDYGTLTIATTRPETIFADVAVAVNPKDARFKKLVGKTATIPLTNREIPIIEDSLVDEKIGSGALKVTPAHDPVDFEIGQKHKLPLISIIDQAGRMSGTPEKYIGMKVLEAREEVVNDLESAGVLKKTERLNHVVGVCYRCKGLIEPSVSKQWFIKVEPLTKPALTAIKSGQVKFASDKYRKIAVHWLKNLRDWNISRQIVWGIRIPAFRCNKCMEWTITDGELPAECASCHNSILTQDPDTFDTWFSSGQWPFATLRASRSGDFDYFYPTSVMDPSYDILPFWVIRMIMLGIYKTGDVPFRTVLLHGLVRDKSGVKISKSKGNVIDPIEMIDKYGSDALRVALVWGIKVENDNSLSEENIRGQRNFANKIWNISRFVLSNHVAIKQFNNLRRPRVTNSDDKWILAELKTTINKVTKSLDKYRLNEAAEEIYEFMWHKFADKYLEKTKERREEAQPVLEFVLREALKLAHPFLPFLTETIWSLGFARDKKDLLIASKWPKI